jgi:CDP-glucose 4,6-dehydratase
MGSYCLSQNNNQFQESQLLNLDVSKAMYYLKWLPTLSFEETVIMTADGYITKEENYFDNRLKQICEYYNKAKEKNIFWTN